MNPAWICFISIFISPKRDYAKAIGPRVPSDRSPRLRIPCSELRPKTGGMNDDDAEARAVFVLADFFRTATRGADDDHSGSRHVARGRSVAGCDRHGG